MLYSVMARSLMKWTEDMDQINVTSITSSSHISDIKTCKKGAGGANLLNS
jgi:hypothetical protein